MAVAKKAKYWTEHEVFSRLSRVFPSGAFALLPQVRNGTGFTRRKVRTCDALAVSCWPSRGLYAAGIEIKVSKTDWRKELQTPEKADGIHKYCRYWYVAAPVSVVPVGEVPETWGLIECTAGGSQVVKPAVKTECVPVDMSFVCAVLRKVMDVTVPVDQARMNVENAKGMSQETEQRLAMLKPIEHELTTLKDTIAKFEEASGVMIRNRWEAGNIGEAVRRVSKHGPQWGVNAAKRLRDMARQIVTTLDLELAEDER